MMNKKTETLNEGNQQGKETFEPLEIKVIDVKVEKGYAASESSSSSVTVSSWENATW